MNGTSKATLCATSGASPTHSAKRDSTSAAVGAPATSSSADAMDLVPDDRAAGVHQRLEPVDDLAIAHLQRGDVDDVAVLRLHGGRLEVEDHELGIEPSPSALPSLTTESAFGPRNGSFFGLPAVSTSFSCRSMLFWSSAWP